MKTDKSDYEELVITRVFDAPKELVWREWSDPARMMRWWGPEYFTAPVIKMDFRVGGKYLWSMRSPDGKDFYSVGEYLEIVPMEKIVYTQNFADEKGNIVPASYYGLPGEWPKDATVTATITFEDLGGKTKMTIREAGIPGGQMGESAKAGWSTSLDKMAADLKIEAGMENLQIITEPGKQVVIVAEVFDAPLDLVYKTMLDPKLIPEWWGPERLTSSVDKMDARAGGMWRFVQQDKDGNKYAFHGVYHEVSPKRTVQTFEYEGMPGHVILEVMSLEDIDGKTKATQKSIFESVEDRDGMLSTGMKEGMTESHERLAKLLENLKKKGKNSAPTWFRGSTFSESTAGL